MTNRHITLGLAALALAVCYAGVFAGLARAWVSSEVYSYGIAVVAGGRGVHGLDEIKRVAEPAA